MMIGDPGISAIESEITQAYEPVSVRAMGFFVIHMGGRCYGVRRPDATMLARSGEFGPGIGWNPQLATYNPQQTTDH